MLELYTDLELQNSVVGNVLEENKRYFAKLKEHDPIIIKKETTKGPCAKYIQWLPDNRFGEILFRDVAGFVNLFGCLFEVRSNKFLRDSSGQSQIDQLLKDISEYSSTLVFSPVAPTGFGYHIDRRKQTNNIYYIYKYLSNHLFGAGHHSLENLLNVILRNPQFNQSTKNAYIPTFSVKKFNHGTFQRVSRSIKDCELIPLGNDLTNNSFIKNMPKTVTGETMFPKKLYSTTNIISYDTPENRFLKYFLKWCQEIFMNVLNIYPQYHVKDDCLKALTIIRKYLFHPFFQQVGKFTYLPISSSVLTNRVGYKELFMHYLQCRNMPKVFSDYLNDMLELMEIKNLSLLYEYWIFFKIAEELFGNKAILQITGIVREGDNIKYGLSISNDSLNLNYNKTYTHSPGGSYSFNLRPDISLEIQIDGSIRRFFFDAKYSNSFIPSAKDDSDVVYKNANVVKMLSYLESIKNSELAVIIYPGKKFSFYRKSFKNGDNYISSPDMMTDFEGVGAIPLSPGHTETNAQFKAFMKNFKTYILELENTAEQH